MNHRRKKAWQFWACAAVLSMALGLALAAGAAHGRRVNHADGIVTAVDEKIGCIEIQTAQQTKWVFVIGKGASIVKDGEQISLLNLKKGNYVMLTYFADQNGLLTATGVAVFNQQPTRQTVCQACHRSSR